MARSSSRARPRNPKPTTAAQPVLTIEAAPSPAIRSLRGRVGVALGVVLLLAVHLTLAVQSLVRENPTIDEVIHLPAGISYWQTGTFKLYHHNPPLVKLIAALPVVRSGVVTDPLYRDNLWAGDYPNKTWFAHTFAELNVADYFELFTRARLLMPLFSVVGALAVFAWSAKLYGPGGGLLSLTLWTFCPNILAHARLITTDVPAAAMGILATFAFWLYLRKPSWLRVILAGSLLGLAQLTKFSLLLLYPLWPVLWLISELAAAREGRWRRAGRAAAQGLLMVVLSILVIDAGYGFEGVGRPIGYMPFVSATLTRPRAHPVFMRPRPKPSDLFDRIHEYRENRFHGTILARLPSPLPYHYLLGFDDQKLEADGIWNRFGTETVEQGDLMGPEGDQVTGYPVYLNGVLSGTSWWYYYFLALGYKVPEGTWFLAVLAFVVAVVSRRFRAGWIDELTLLVPPIVVLAVISFLTNINLGLRYVVPIFPYVFVACGKLVPWALDMQPKRRQFVAASAISIGLVATIAPTLLIHPHYLAYFNVLSGGPDRGSNHLIDSNLDWGQDLVQLKVWADKNAPDEPIGLAYFGQINPSLFNRRKELGVAETGLTWFLPPPRPGSIFGRMPPRWARMNRATRLKPGLYAVSASLVRGLPWRVYDSPVNPPPMILPGYFDDRRGGFSYFRDLKPFHKIGYSIFLYRVTKEDSDRLAWVWASEPQRR